MVGAKPISTPYSSSTKISKHTGTSMTDPTLYRQTVGPLQYATITRLDILFVVNEVSKFIQTPTHEHWSLVKRILRYLKNTLKYGVQVSKSPNFQLSAFSNADWAGCPDDTKSQGGRLSCFLLLKSHIMVVQETTNSV